MKFEPLDPWQLGFYHQRSSPWETFSRRVAVSFGGGGSGFCCGWRGEFPWAQCSKAACPAGVSSPMINLGKRCCLTDGAFPYKCSTWSQGCPYQNQKCQSTKSFYISSNLHQSTNVIEKHGYNLEFHDDLAESMDNGLHLGIHGGLVTPQWRQRRRSPGWWPLHASELCLYLGFFWWSPKNGRFGDTWGLVMVILHLVDPKYLNWSLVTRCH